MIQENEKNAKASRKYNMQLEDQVIDIPDK